MDGVRTRKLRTERIRSAVPWGPSGRSRAPVRNGYGEGLGSASVARTRAGPRGTHLAAPTGRAREREVVNICRLRVPLPESTWVGQFSRLYPDVTVEVLSRLDVGNNRSLTEIRLHSSGNLDLGEALRDLPLVTDVEELEREPGAIHFRVIHRTSVFVPIFRELRLMRRFPFRIAAGEASWVVVAPESKVRSLLVRLRQAAPGAILESVQHVEPARLPGGLTPRQSELLRRAVAAGYFEVPRKISLTGLAESLDLAPSSLSEALAIVEKKLLESWPAVASP